MISLLFIVTAFLFARLQNIFKVKSPQAASLSIDLLIYSTTSLRMMPLYPATPSKTEDRMHGRTMSAGIHCHGGGGYIGHN
jgi:hypothetical protein